MLAGSCAFVPNRSFVEEMEHESDGFFIPGQDFKIIAGDGGSAYRSTNEINKRTPASIFSKKRMQHAGILSSELTKLKIEQSPKELSHYKRYEGRLQSISNKIYFLKIPTIRARDQYLYNLGVYNSPFHTSPEETHAIQNNDVLLGMSKIAVSKAWGKPERVEVAGNPKYQNERWTYRRRGKRRYIFFSNGQVEGWEGHSSVRGLSY